MEIINFVTNITQYYIIMITGHINKDTVHRYVKI